MRTPRSGRPRRVRPPGPAAPRRGRAGFTLLELTIAMTLTLLVFAAVMPLLQMQARAVSAYAGRSDANLTVQFGVNTIDRELRMAGVGVTDAQAMLVYAAPRALTFNANLVTTTVDPTAVYTDPDAPAAATTALPKSRAILLPLSTLAYPDTSYTFGAGGTPGLAETVSYWVEPDPAGVRTDQQLLYRRVNDQPRQLVARGIVVAAGQPVFRYFEHDSSGRQVEIPGAQLPLFHRAPVHSLTTGVKPDTGNSARTDAVRAVGVQLVGLYRDKRTGRDVLDTADVRIRVMNAGLNRVASCGERPRFTALLTPSFVTLPGGGVGVQLAWSGSTDELGGEKDVERYLVLRREATASLFAEPIATVPAGTASHTFVDDGVRPGESWVYGVAAQDCTPSTSAVITTTVVVP